MKKYLLLVLVGIFSCLQLSAQSSNNASPKHEFRATWCATVTNIDWPTTKVTDNASRTAQQKELTDILDALQAGNINAVCLQVRSLCDALYESSYEPWAVCLTGTRGKDPGYDPLLFAIEECHKRGMELHVWINPYRVTSEKSTTGNPPYQALPETDMLYTHGESHLSGKVIEYQNEEKYGQVLDPGYPEVRAHIVKVLQEIVTNYDIDGMLMDDYFYPTGADDYDAASQALYFTPNKKTIVDFNENGINLDDWRRSNVDQMVRDVYQMIQNEKPYVRFGMGPFGIWSYNENIATEKYGLVHPQGIKGANYYTERGCNTVEWIKQGWVDYVCPQLYWPTTQADQDYNVLYEWWSGVCEKFSTDNRKVHFYPSPNAGRVYGADGKKWGIAEMKLQLNQGRELLTNGYSGAVFYSVRYYLNLDYLGNPICGNDVTTTMCEDLKASHFQQKALVPPMKWKSTGSLEAPTELSISGNTLTWESEGERYTIYVYPKGVEMHTAIEQVDYLQRVVYGNSFTLPAGFNTATHNVAVRSYDRYGVEHAATEYTPDVTYVLNGGKLESVPTNEELWEAFMTYFNEYYPANTTTAKGITFPRTKRDITDVASFWYGASDGSVVTDANANIMTNTNSKYKWLGDYIKKVATDQGYTIPDETYWRYNLWAFFNCTLRTLWPATADFSTAGKPEAWGPAYQAANGGTGDPYTLPDFIETALTLPTEDSRPVYITHPNEYTFLGWIDQTGASITELSVGYKGTVYAQWNSPIKWVLNGGAYTGHHELPLTVVEEYYLPTAFAMRKEGYKFAGWYDNASFTGEVITTIPANYTGTLYATWEPATHVTWHPYPYYDVTNEDLWELFVEDYNAFYQNRDILGEKVSSGAKSYQPMTGAFGFTFSLAADKEKDGFRDGRLKDFMTHPKSPWRWLGDYITEVLEEENESLDSNAPLWTSFKEATGLTGLGALETMDFATICGKRALDTDDEDGKTGGTILAELFAQPEWEWLRDYIADTQNADAGKTIGSTTILALDKNDLTSRQWAYAVAAFFLQDQRKEWPASADFSTAGKHSVWKDIIPEEYHDLGHFRITNELEWRKTVAAFFNHTNVLTYTLNSGVSKTEGTADFRNLGLPKPNGDPAAGWYNAWWNATFPEYMIDDEALPKIKRKNYVFGGWYYGNDKGYIFTEGTKADPDAYSSANNYKNHLWGRWLELCLYEGYVDPDPAALDANGQAISSKVNNNVEMVICNAEEITRTGISRKVDIERKLTGGTYNTMFLPFGINGAGGKVDDVQMNGKAYYLRQVVDDNGKPLLDPETTSILVYDNAVVETIGGEEVIAFNFHEYAEENSSEPLYAYTPFLIKPENDITVRMHFWSALMQDPANAGARTSAVQAFVEGVLAPTVIPVNPEGDNTLILVADNRLAKVTTQGEMLGLRLYFTVPKDVSPSARSIIRVNNAPAGIDDIETPQQGAAVIKIMQNGNIYIIRNGVTYTITGARVQ